MIRRLLALVAQSCIAAAIILEFPDCEKGPLAENPVCNVDLAPAERAAAIVAAMTIDEKLANLVDKSPGAPRLGLPPYMWWNEALHGVGFSPGVTFNETGEFASATSFANPILLAAAFDDDLVYDVATAIATEARAFSNSGFAGLDYWSPNINPYKDPRWGRGMETPGEDPRRIRGYVEALIAGLEGPDRRTKRVIATCKHYAGNDLDRWQDVLRFNFSATIGLQDLAEYYLPPFRQCARDSRAGSFMCAYNAVNGTPACSDEYLLQTVLREHWNWSEPERYVTSDCNAVQNIVDDHRWVDSAAEAAAAAISAGTDTVCEYLYKTDLAGAYQKGLLDEPTIDRALTRLYAGLARVGYFDPPEMSSYRSIAWKHVGTPETHDLALRSAADGIVLKKNDGTLPLKFDEKQETTIAIMGHWAQQPRFLLGAYQGRAPFYLTPLYVAQELHGNVRYVWVPSVQIASVNDSWTSRAVDAAKEADFVVYFGGQDLYIERESLDRINITLPEIQHNVIDKACAVGKPCIVVQMGGQTDDTPLLQNNNVSAVLWAGYPGQFGGRAVFDVIYGNTAPAGRLPVTQYPARYVDEVPMTDMTLRPAEGNPGRTYKWYSEAVLPFGFGLHYTTFEAEFVEAPKDKGRPQDKTKQRHERYLKKVRVENEKARKTKSSLPAVHANMDAEDNKRKDMENPKKEPSKTDPKKLPVKSPKPKKSIKPKPRRRPGSYSFSELLSGCDAPYLDLCPLDTIAVSIHNTGKKSSDFVTLVFVNGTYGPEPRPLKELAAYARARDIESGETVMVEVDVALGDVSRVDWNGNTILYAGQYSLLLDEPTQDVWHFEIRDDREEGDGMVILDEWPQPADRRSEGLW